MGESFVCGCCDFQTSDLAEAQAHSCVVSMTENENLKKFRHLPSLFESLEDVIVGSVPGNCPRWDGTLISKKKKNALIESGMVEKHKGWYFPTAVGIAIWDALCNANYAKLKSFPDIYVDKPEDS